MKKSLRSRLLAIIAAVAVTAALCGCDETAGGFSDYIDSSNDSSSSAAEEIEVQQADFDDVQEYSQNGSTSVVFNGSSIVTEGTGCVIDGSTLKITREGTYILSGQLNGQVIIDGDGEKFRIVLNGVDITCENSSPLYIRDAKKVTLTLADGTENTLTDGTSYDYDDAANEEPNAALFSKADLIIEGGGSLTVNGNFNNGITGKDTFEIHSGSITVNAVNHGINGKDSLAIKDGTFRIVAGGDAIRSTEDTDTSLGWISISGGTFDINAGQDAIQAETTIYIGGGNYSIVTGGGSANSSANNSGWGNWQPGNNFGGGGGRSSDRSSFGETSDSAKAIKAGSNVLIEAGNITIDSSDDALHSNGSLGIAGGVINISSGDDGIHADSVLNISDGVVNITKSYEGIEGVSVTISGGEVSLVSSDDGINSAGGNNSGDRPGANMFAADSSCDVTISGGVVKINASGDGIDSNGNLHLSGGVLILSGPVDSANGPLDYAGECVITGGKIGIAGSSGMVQGGGRSSTQANMLLCFTGYIEGGTLISLTDDKGNVIAAFAPETAYSSALLSVPAMAVGDTYRLWLGGTCTGVSDNGYYTDGTLEGATEITEVTSSEISTYYGGSMNGMGGPGGHGGGPGGGHGGPGGGR